MKRALVLLWLLSAAAVAQTVTPQQAQNLAADLADDKKRAALIADLRTLAAVREKKPVATPVRVGANVLQSAADGLSRISAQLLRSLALLGQLPAAATWAFQAVAHGWARDRIAEAAVKLVGLFALAFAAGFGARRLTTRLLQRLARHAAGEPQDPAPSAANHASPATPPIDAPPLWVQTDASAQKASRLSHLLRLLPFAMLRLLLDLIPVAIGVGVGYLLLGTSLGDPPKARLIGLALLGILAVARLVWVVMQALASPTEPRLRLLALGDADAASLVRWTSWISVAAVASFAISAVAGLLGMPAAPLNALSKLVTLVVHLMLAAAVLRARAPVARYLRGMGARRGAAQGFAEFVAAIWAWVAIFFIMALWFVWAIALQEGPTRLLQTGGASILVLTGARLVTILGLGSLERGVRRATTLETRLPGIGNRALHYALVLRLLFQIALFAVCVLLLFHFWGWDRGDWFGIGRWGRHLLSGSATILVALACAAALWELANLWLNRHIERLTTLGALERLTRLRTLLPLLRTCLMVTLGVVLGMTVLSEIGVNIAPLLAGAGIVGLAIGFGSQKLVQDVITGLFLLLDNAVEVGDGITAAGISGTVEHLSLCYLRLRGADGTLHFIPYSSVTTVSNSNRGGQAVAMLRFDFKAGTDFDAATALLTRIGRQMREDANFDHRLLGDLALQGIEDMTGTKIAISAQFPCVTASSGAVIYEFRRLLALALAQSEIKLAGGAPVVQLVTTAPIEAAAAPAAEAGHAAA